MNHIKEVGPYVVGDEFTIFTVLPRHKVVGLHCEYDPFTFEESGHEVTVIEKGKEKDFDIMSVVLSFTIKKYGTNRTIQIYEPTDFKTATFHKVLILPSFDEVVAANEY